MSSVGALEYKIAEFGVLLGVEENMRLERKERGWEVEFAYVCGKA